MNFLFDDASPAASPPDTEAVRLGAQRIRELKDLLQSYLIKFLTNAGAYQTNLVPATILTNSSITSAQIAAQSITKEQIVNATFSDGLLKAANADPVTVNIDNTTITFDSSSPKKIQVGTIPVTNAGVIVSVRNLVVQTASISTVTVTADEILLKNATSAPYLASAVSLTASIAASGANGLDTGAEAASTWYYVWVIYNGTTVASLLSLQSTRNATFVSNLPSGYTYAALVGAVRNGVPGGTTTDLMTSYQIDREVFLNDTVVFTAKTGTNGSWATISGADLTAFQGLVPPIAKVARGNMGNTANDGGIAVAANTSALGAQVSHGQAVGSGTLSYAVGGVWRTVLTTAQTFSYIMGNGSAGYRVSCSGYSI